MIMKNKEHLTEEGLKAITDIKASLNRGLSEELNTIFPNTIPVKRPVVNQIIPDPQWLAGFTTAEGNFFF